MSSLAMLKIVEKQNEQLREQNRVLRGAMKQADELLAEFVRTIDDDHFYRECVIEKYQALQAALTATSQPGGAHEL